MTSSSGFFNEFENRLRAFIWASWNQDTATLYPENLTAEPPIGPYVVVGFTWQTNQYDEANGRARRAEGTVQLDISVESGTGPAGINAIGASLADLITTYTHSGGQIGDLDWQDPIPDPGTMVGGRYEKTITIPFTVIYRP